MVFLKKNNLFQSSSLLLTLELVVSFPTTHPPWLWTRNKTPLRKQTHIMCDTTLQFLCASPAGHSRAQHCLGKHSTDTSAVEPVGATKTAALNTGPSASACRSRSAAELPLADQPPGAIPTRQRPAALALWEKCTSSRLCWMRTRVFLISWTAEVLQRASY